jgi:hypothetical protein
MSMKLEKTAVSSFRVSKGLGVSNDSIIGERKCCTEMDHLLCRRSWLERMYPLNI